jgi:predicted transcriptional regulator
VLDDKDLEFIEALQNLGVNQNVAKLITYLKDVDEGSSRDIEMATGMRQPEVSIAMGTLRTMKWISERDIKSPGKGRPTGIYSLRTTIEEIIEHYEAEKKQESTQTIEAIQRLKELSPAL